MFEAVARHVDWAVVKCLVVAGPGFAKDSLKAFLDAEAARRDFRPLIENRARVIVAPVSPSLVGCWIREGGGSRRRSAEERRAGRWHDHQHTQTRNNNTPSHTFE